jgi:hypothetical protein
VDGKTEIYNVVNTKDWETKRNIQRVRERGTKRDRVRYKETNKRTE